MQNRIIRYMVPGLFLIYSSALYAAQFEVQIVNASRKKPGHAESVKLLIIGQKMQTVGEVKNVTGKVQFENVEPNGRYLLQTISQGVKYFHILDKSQLTSDSQNNLKPFRIEVFDHKKRNGNYVVSLDHLAVFKDRESYVIKYQYNMNNVTKENGPIAITEPNGYRVSAPNVPDNDITLMLNQKDIPEHLQVDRMKNGDFLIKNPIKPGMHQLILEYRLKEKQFNIQFPFALKHGHFFVQPLDIGIQFSENKYFKLEEQKPEENYKLYQIAGLPAHKKIVVTLQGGSDMAAPQDNEEKKGEGNVKSVLAMKLPFAILLSLLLIGFFSYKLWVLTKHEDVTERKNLSDILQQLAQFEDDREKGSMTIAEYSDLSRKWKQMAIQKLISKQGKK